MTPLRKTRFCLALFIILAAATCSAQDYSAPGAATATSAAPVTSQASQPGSVTVTSQAPRASAGVITPARLEDWTFLGSDDDDDVSVELALVVPNREMDLATTSQIIEDLGIMSRIIEKNVLTPYGIERKGWRDVFVGVNPSPQAGPRALFSLSGRPKPLYIGGYGATFFISVDFPLLPPPEKKQEQPTQAQEDPVWAQTRQSLREPRPSGMAPRGEHAGQPYSQGRVDSFRRSLISTMKHATNIRGLEPGEWLIFVVQSAGFANAGSAQGMTTGTRLPMIVGASAGMASGRSVMTLRATKADVDACAKGQLSQEQFEQRVQVITY